MNPNSLAARRANLTPAQSALLDRRLKQKGLDFSGKKTIAPRAMRDSAPLSFAQQRFWFLDQLEPGSAVYNIPEAFRLKGPLDIKSLEQSLSEIVRRHEALRTTFKSVQGCPLQVISSEVVPPLLVLDLTCRPESEREDAARQVAALEAQRPFDLEIGPLVRVMLLRLDQEHHVLILTMHHIVSDAWSMGVLFQELSTLYGAFSQGKPSPLSELQVQYADYAVWQRGWLQGEVLEKQLGYWKKQLENISTAQLPTDGRRPAVQSFRGGRESSVLSTELTEDLKALSREQRVTLFMTLLAAFKILLCRYTGQEDIAIGSPIAGRNRTEIEKLIGFFINTLVLRTDLTGNPSFLALLERVRDVTLGAYTHQDLPFEKLLEELRPERNLSRTPLFQVFFNMINVGGHPVELSGLKVERLSPSEIQSNFDMTMYVEERNGTLHFNLVYNTDLFGPARIAEMLRQYQELLSQIVKHPDRSIYSYSLLTAGAETLLPNPAEPMSSDWAGSVQDKFSQQAKRLPDQLAITDPHHSWTYQELNECSNQLAHYLLERDIGRENIVAVYGHRSASLVWALLGILKTGAAFLILDPAYPPARLVDYVRAARPRGFVHLKASGEVPAELDELIQKTDCCRATLPKLSAFGFRNSLKRYSTADPNIEIGPEDLAYVSYTSGSTGEPKGILGRHGPLSHFLPWQAEHFALTSSDRFSLLSGLSHDPLHREIFTALWVGARICMPEPDILGALGGPGEWMARERITFAHLTPALGRLLTTTANPINQVPDLRYLFVVGDKLTWNDAARLQCLAPKAICVNYYGSTETQRAVSYYEVPPAPRNKEAQGIVPVGRGMPNVQLLVLNTEQKLAGIGEVGEIYMRSPHLARGYLGDEPLTQARFLPNSFTNAPGDRLYRTGDLGRYLPDGNVEIFGRVDRQVKIRGFRIELSEIESVLHRHPGVREAVVLVREDIEGENTLAAYIVTNQQTLNVHELRSLLKKHLPGYMMPSSFTRLDALPLTPNGKIDRKALPVPNRAQSDFENLFLAPRNDLEFQLTKIWESVLCVQPIGVKDNFFDLGGYSLLAVKLFAETDKITSRKLPLSVLFQAPTIEQLARIIRRETSAVLDSSLVPIQPGGTKPRLFLIHAGGGEVLFYGDLARHLGPDQPVYGLRALGLDENQPPHCRIEDMAAHYIKEIQSLQPEGPYFLGGYCLGANVAFEMAQQLQRQGQAVSLIILDAGFFGWPPPIHVPSRNALDHYFHRFVYHRQQRLLIGASLNYALDHLKKVGHKVSYVLSNSQDRRHQRMRAAHRKAIIDYRAKVFPGRIMLVRSREFHDRLDKDWHLKWSELAGGGFEYDVVPGTHLTMMQEPHVQILAEKLQAFLQEAQTTD